MEALTETATSSNKPKRAKRRKGHKSARRTANTIGNVKAKKKNATVPKGKKYGAIAERRAKAEMAKLDKKAAVGTETKKILTALKPVAKEINVKFRLATQLDGKADDHRLSAALLLESARRRCKEAKIPFTKWCEDNVEKSYDEVRKLVAVASAPEPAKALADLRSRTAQRNRDMRKRQKSASRDTGLSAPQETPWEAADALVESLPDNEALSLLKARAGPLGMAVVSETDKNRLSRLDEDETSAAFATRDKVYRMFLSLKASDQLELVKEMAEHIGGEFTHDFDYPEEGPPSIPESMRRKK